jgi:hypothetical protein
MFQYKLMFKDIEKWHAKEALWWKVKEGSILTVSNWIVHIVFSVPLLMNLWHGKQFRIGTLCMNQT